MIYCQPCMVKNTWPAGATVGLNTCEVCSEVHAACLSLPYSALCDHTALSKLAAISVAAESKSAGYPPPPNGAAGRALQRLLDTIKSAIDDCIANSRRAGSNDRFCGACSENIAVKYKDYMAKR